MGKTNPVISLIIPVYNVQDYLRKALCSVMAQTFEDFEAIIINDGSTDKSQEIIEEFLKKDARFQLVNQENAGLSAARNTGLKKAQGEYVAFLDSDDFLKEDYLETLYQTAVKNDADIVYCNYEFYYPKINRSFFMPCTSRRAVYSKTKALRKLIMDITLHFYSWNKLCKRSLFSENDVWFYDMFFEDISTSPRLFYFANKVAVLRKSLYYYTKRKGSILSTMDVKKINDYTKAMGMIRHFLEQQNDYQAYRASFRIYAYRVALVNYYSIFQMHFRERNFRGMRQNFKRSNKSIRYFISDKYKLTADSALTPYPIELPPKRSRAVYTESQKPQSSISGEENETIF